MDWGSLASFVTSINATEIITQLEGFNVSGAPALVLGNTSIDYPTVVSAASAAQSAVYEAADAAVATKASAYAQLGAIDNEQALRDTLDSRDISETPPRQRKKMVRDARCAPCRSPVPVTMTRPGHVRDTSTGGVRGAGAGRGAECDAVPGAGAAGHFRENRDASETLPRRFRDPGV